MRRPRLPTPFDWRCRRRCCCASRSYSRVVRERQGSRHPRPPRHGVREGTGAEPLPSSRRHRRRNCRRRRDPPSPPSDSQPEAPSPNDAGYRPPDGPARGSPRRWPLIVYGLDGALISAVSSGGRFVTNETAVTTSGRVMVSDMTVFDRSVMLTGTEYALDNETSSLRMWTSTDGLTWSEVGPSGLEPSAHLTALTTTDDACNRRDNLRSRLRADPHAAMWRSTPTAVQWEAMTVPDLGPRAIVGALFRRRRHADHVRGRPIMFVGGGTARALYSTDGGVTWVDSAVGVDALAVPSTRRR